MNNKLETRMYSVNYEVNESDDNGIVRGRPIVFNSQTDIGPFDEIIEPTALDGTDLTDVRFCLNHDTSFVYARSRKNNPNSTMRLMPGSEGLDIEASLAIKESPRAMDLYTAIKRGDLDKMSFMFSVENDEWEGLEGDHPLRRIKKIGSVVEVSAVTFPAYNATELQIARSKEALESARSALENARQQRATEVETSDIDETLLLLRAQTETLKLL